MQSQTVSLIHIFPTVGLCTMFLWYGASISGAAEQGLKTAKIESMTGLKCALNEDVRRSTQ
jgi:hypothetical protein